ncbi:hypothetical protein TL16_g04527 [Triparma laevis f. inornata]|uniref:TNFR-Cys domain-containing protein n=1 Tax=Triparma laevis f. inornata TaxID=1714386 RepID=A0A9W7A739_9STRA|nr:hypothetical protein TL16_g04527 [Triparma laevis f. inornata]
MENVLGVRFPPIFERFCRFCSSFVNLSFLEIAKVDCFVPTNFYVKLVVMTIAPLVLTLSVALIGYSSYRCASNPERRNTILNDTIAVILAITYMVFNAVSTTIFETFNCTTYGDDEQLYMRLDQSVVCTSNTHIIFKYYASIFTAIYPVGTPALYFWLVFKDRAKLQDEGEKSSTSNTKLLRTSFLWDQYSPEFYWFDVFDCVRRLSQSGLLIFVFSGASSQIVVAILISGLMGLLLTHWKPYADESDNMLAIITQLSIFCTLFAALLTKVGIDKDDKYDKASFGILLIVVNCSGIAMILATGLVKPIRKVLKVLGRKHVHSAPLKGLTKKHKNLAKFYNYFDELIMSNAERAGWEDCTLKIWKDHDPWIEERNVKAVWRIHYLMDLDLGGLFGVDWVNRRAAPRQIKKIVKRFKHLETTWNGIDEDIRVSFKHTTSKSDKSDYRDDDEDSDDEDSIGAMAFQSENPLRAGAEGSLKENDGGLQLTVLSGGGSVPKGARPPEPKGANDRIDDGNTVRTPWSASVCWWWDVATWNIQIVKVSEGCGRGGRCEWSDDNHKNMCSNSISIFHRRLHNKAEISSIESRSASKCFAKLELNDFINESEDHTQTESKKLSGVSSLLHSHALASRLFLLVLMTLVVETKAGITLSGSSTGSCYVRDNCFGTGSTSGTYNANERCTFTFSDAAGFVVGRFNVESQSSCDYDSLTIGSTLYCGTSGPSDGSVTAGQQMTWLSDDTEQRTGFEICITGDPCVASTSPSDDGSDGNFYCVNGGTIGGFTGSCTCTSCNTGFGGLHCTDGPHHTWDFRNCVTGQDVADTGQDEGKIARPMNGPTCSAAGISLDGDDDYVNVETFQFGGATSFEVLVKYDSFNYFSRVFDFSNGASSDNVVMYNWGSSPGAEIGWAILQGGSQSQINSNNFDSSTWTHVVVTVSGNTMKIYKNGVLVGTTTDGHEPNVMTRSQHWLGRSAWSTQGYMDGTIAYVKMWIGVELQQSDVTNLYEAERCVASTSSSADGSDGNFYCVNGGTIGGFTGSCTCTSCDRNFGGLSCATSCPVGYGGTSCDVALTCVANTSLSDDGSDGNFYCINGGTVGGYTGSCTCTSCNTGFVGSSCETPTIITLSGESQGTCYISDDGACFGTGSADGTYNFDEACTFTFSDDAGFAVGRFDIYDHSSCSIASLTVDSTKYCGTSGPSDGSLTAGQQVTFTSNHNFGTLSPGFEICTGDPCVASTSPSDNGSDGDFYCINGGTVGGYTGSCTCTSCNTGFGGSSCELPACVASMSPSDDGSDGNFYCINGGTVGGFAGSCTCTCVDGGTGWTSCAECEEGKISSAGADRCYSCSSGKYSGTASAICFDCPAGKHINSGRTGGESSVCSNCAAGQYSGAASATCSDCTAGKYSPTGASVCTSCGAGKYSSSPGSSDEFCLDCDAGTFSEQGSASCITCSFGKYSSAASASCTSCPSGKYITDDATTASLHADDIACFDCDAGKSSTPPAPSCPIVCPIGTYAAGTPCLDCEAGKFNENVQQESCTECGTGRYSTTTGNTIESDCRNCEAGKASSEEVRTTPCPACPEGKSAPAPGLSSCPSCPAGTYSNSPDGATNCALCSVGKYTSAAQSTSCDDCNTGSFNLVEGSVTCDKCPAGQKMNNAGNDCEVCPDGKFSNPGSISCSNCDETPGYVSLAGDSGADKCEYCGPGFYADQISHTCKELASTSCLPCPPGTIPTGYSCNQCEKGKYGEFGATSCTLCDGEGQYADELGLAACKTAPARMKPTTNHQGVEDCAAGTYSVGGANECSKCRSGETSAAGAAGCSTCAVCEPGKYKILDCTTDTETQCGDCLKGQASMGGEATSCTECDSDGKYSDEDGASVCKTAPAGSKPTSNREGIENCTAGTYSVGGADECSLCGAGERSGEGAAGCSPCEQYMAFDEAKKTCVCLDTFVTKADGSCTCKAGETLVDGNCTACEDGRYKSQPGTGSCTICDTTAIRGAFDTIPGTEKTSDGYWRSSSQSDKIVECENHASCVHPNTTDLCTIGHKGPICSVCEEGYIKNATGVCKPCSSTGVSIGFYALLTVFSITTLYFILRKIFGKKKLTITNISKEMQKATADDKYWSQRLKTKAKILTSFYQIVSKLPSTLAVKYPDFYRGFTTAVSSVFNFNVIGVISVGCFLPQSIYSFYGSFLITTITPIVFSLLLLIATIFQHRKLVDPHAANQLSSSRFSLFYAFTYLIFASTSTTAFATFLCTTYGDDKTEYLIADRNIDCNSDFHKKFEILSIIMILIYPIGITALYSYELWKHREDISDAQNRDKNEKIQHINFLWRDYRPEFWWYEIYECFRRLSFTGMLVYFDPGSPAQLCFSMILAAISMLMFAYNQPFEKAEENTLAQISSVSIFLTLLAGILITLKENLDKEYNDKLSTLLVIINTLVFAMVGTSVLFKPIFKLFLKFNEKQIHDAPLKSMGPEVAYSVDLFIKYFKRLAESDAEEAGWTPLTMKDWSGKKKKIKEWLEETGAKAEWRNTNGNGPIDQARIRYVVDADVETMLGEIKSIKNTHNMTVGSFIYILDKGSDWRQIYRAIKLPWPFRQRDLVYTEHTRWDPGGDILICSRSSRELSDSTSGLSVKAGRMRAELQVGGYRLRGAGSGKTEIVCLIDMDLGGSFGIGYLHRHMAQSYLKGVVDMHRKFAEANKRDGAVSEPPPPLPFLPKVLAATNPMFMRSRNTDSSVDDSLNIEMGRMIKKVAGKSDDDEINNNM